MEENEMISKSNLASPGHRIGAIAVDLGFYLITFGIGHFIWNLVVMAQGQSPGKQLLKVRVMSETFNKPATWGHMAVRNFLIPTTMALPFLIPYYVWIFKEFNTNALGIILLAVCFLIYLTVLIIDFVWLFAPKRKRLIDYWAKTYVVNESAIKSS